MEKALFIDRDGTINVDCPYCIDPSQIKIYQDAIELIKSYKKFGYLIIVISNQSGIGRGFFTASDVDKFNDALNNCLIKLGAGIDSFYYCPHLPIVNCECRKPKTELFKRAVSEQDIDLINSIMVGDRDDMDGGAARALGIHFKIMIRTGNEKTINYSDCNEK
ncbi:MAG: D-glycero-alpha-D-manno-heptose-1,7-bisphosphate 7-phosphatase [Thermoplasmataceae archaeon]